MVLNYITKIAQNHYTSMFSSALVVRRLDHLIFVANVSKNIQVPLVKNMWQGSTLRVNLWPQASKNSQKQLRASKKRPQLVLQGQ